MAKVKEMIKCWIIKISNYMTISESRKKQVFFIKNILLWIIVYYKFHECSTCERFAIISYPSLPVGRWVTPFGFYTRVFLRGDFFLLWGAPVPGVESFFYRPASVPSWLGEKNFSVSQSLTWPTSGRWTRKIFVSRLTPWVSYIPSAICEHFDSMNGKYTTENCVHYKCNKKNINASLILCEDYGVWRI